MNNALTKAEDWNEYHEKGYQISILPDYMLKLIDRKVWSKHSGRIFELGCGGSAFFTLSASKGCSVSGIDFNKGGLFALEEHLKKMSWDIKRLYMVILTFMIFL